MTTSAVSATSRGLPQGVVTFLFTDIAGSTQLLRRLGEAYGEVLARHRSLLRRSFLAHGGREVDTQGDSFFVAFASPREAVAAAVQAQRALAAQSWPQGESVRVRMGLHTGEPLLVDGHYIGIDVHRAARIANTAHGGQVVVSAQTRPFLEEHRQGALHLKDLGHHRLKDLEKPEHILQLVVEGLPDSFPPLKSLQPPSNVPRHVGAVVGRERELRELAATLLGPDLRLVTVTGAGGTGKTRVAAAVALSLLEKFTGGVFFVDLSTVGDESLVASTIVRALEVPLDAECPAEEALAQHIGSRHMLLVLDNFEHLLDAAGMLVRLLEACPLLSLLVTSRLTLSMQSEHEYPLQPMELARGRSLADVQRSEAVQLFVQRAQRARRGFALTEANAAATAEICALVDGLPLAIELAAARIKLFSARTLLSRLDNRLNLLTGGALDSPIRHRALRTTIDWSYDLLSPQERAFFRDLAIFRGGADYEAIEAVIPCDCDTMDLVTSLVNHSLIRQQEDPNGDIRFRMLQTLLDYGAELLARDPAHAADLRERHARYYLAVADEVNQLGAHGPFDYARLERDQDNLRAALRFWLEERAESDQEAAHRALRLTSILGSYWYHRGQAIEGASWLERALARAIEPPVDVEATALRMLGVLTEQRRDFDRAIDLFERALELYRREQDRPGEAACLNSLGVTTRSGLREGAEEFLEQAAQIRRELGDRSGLATALNNLGIIYIDQGKVDLALELFTENLRTDQECNDDWGAACTMLNLGTTHLLLGDIEKARATVHEALSSFVDMGDLDGTAEALEICSGLAVAQEHWVPAARIAGASDALRLNLGLPCAPADRAHLDMWIASSQEALGPEAFRAAWLEGAAMTSTQATTYAAGEIVGGEDSEGQH
ncbi:MAG: tetratricopeptide repeat protein [Actinomycetota bacterium]|nr:tetratricopeptide repeat protein [Actinomycetota bacterium]